MANHNSSFVRGTGYDYGREVLTLYLNGRRYEVGGFPEQELVRMLHYPSLGRFFNRYIRHGGYSIRRIDDV